ncbi:MAG: hypothetical protein VX293_10220 [Candidatus Latescibacterota bacterium]|nr:hypothetical protein [Candidatus Latescibacterota bacterium]
MVKIIDADQTEDFVPEEARRFDDDGTAHRMADEHDLFKCEGFDYGGDIGAEGGYRPGVAVPAGLAVAGQVDGDGLVLRREDGQLLVPVVAVTAPAVGLVVQGDAVGGSGSSHGGNMRRGIGRRNVFLPQDRRISGHHYSRSPAVFPV